LNALRWIVEEQLPTYCLAQCGTQNGVRISLPYPLCDSSTVLRLDTAYAPTCIRLQLFRH
jgi:hypothetical protein